MTKNDSVPQSADPSYGAEAVSFSTFVLSLASAAFIEMGVVPDPSSNAKRKNLTSAKQHVDLLEMLQDKTRGNLSEEERGLLERVLRDLRLEFVKTSQKDKS